MAASKELKPTAWTTPTLAEARAVQALIQGAASEEQQKVAWNFITLRAAGAAYDNFVPGQPDTTAYLAGRRSVALQLAWIVKTPVEKFRKGESDA